MRARVPRSGLIAALLAVGAMLLGTGQAAAAPRYPVPYTFLAGITAAATQPYASPPGSNDFGCRPGAAHPNPIVLTHGLSANQADNWQTFAPLLANNGYCVFSLTYGNRTDVPFPGDQVGGVLPMERSAAQLKSFVDKVLAATGAAKVDILGHSEGTLMPEYYVKFLGGAAHVDKYVSLTPLWNGTSLAGLDRLYAAGRVFGLDGVVDGVLDPACGSCRQFLAGSDFLTKLRAGGVYAPGVTYTNIATRYDELVLPYTSGLEPGPRTTNITLQDGCPTDFADHVAVAADPVAAQHVLNALDPAHATPVRCSLVLPFTGGLS